MWILTDNLLILTTILTIYYIETVRADFVHSQYMMLMFSQLYSVFCYVNLFFEEKNYRNYYSHTEFYIYLQFQSMLLGL
jgi:hypothetical protein